MRKIHSFKALKEILKAEEYQDKVVGYLHGAFDLLHAGHIELFEDAKDKCDVLVVGIDTDEYIKKYKYSRPVFDKASRVYITSNLELIDFVVPFESTNSLFEYYADNLKLLKPNKYFTNSLGTPHYKLHSKQADYASVKLVNLKREKLESSKEVYKRVLKKTIDLIDSQLISTAY